MSTNLLSHANANPMPYTIWLLGLRCLNVLKTFTVSSQKIKINTHGTNDTRCYSVCCCNFYLSVYAMLVFVIKSMRCSEYRQLVVTFAIQSKSCCEFHDWVNVFMCVWPFCQYEEKKNEIWPSPMTKTPIPTENSKTKGQHTQTPPKTSITQQLRTDLGRSVGVTSNPTGVVKPVYGIPTFPLTAKAV